MKNKLKNLLPTRAEIEFIIPIEQLKVVIVLSALLIAFNLISYLLN